MISSKLKQHFVKKKTVKLSVKRNGKKAVSNKKVQSVGILTEEKFFQEYDLQKLVEEHLGLRNPKVYSYRKFDKNQEQSYKHFSENDFDWKAQIIESSFQSFLDQTFDVLICFFPTNHPYLDYTALLSQATFKVGFTGVDANLFDLEISVKASEVDEFFVETKKYLTILNKL